MYPTPPEFSQVVFDLKHFHDRERIKQICIKVIQVIEGIHWVILIQGGHYESPTLPAYSASRFASPPPPPPAAYVVSDLIDVSCH